jgi:hypothetical protein
MKLNKDGFKPGQILTEAEYLEAKNKMRSKKDDSQRPRGRKKTVRKDDEPRVANTSPSDAAEEAEES